jgi:hypothetical protein
MRTSLSALLLVLGTILVAISLPVRLLAIWIYDIASHRFDLDGVLLTLYLKLSLLERVWWIGHVEWLVGLPLILIGLFLREQSKSRAPINK